MNNKLKEKELFYQDSFQVLDGIVDLIVKNLSEELYFDGRTYTQLILDTYAPKITELNDLDYLVSEENRDNISFTDLIDLLDKRQVIICQLISEFNRFI